MACAGRADQLKERTLGVELFGRDPAYDTGEDAIVRVKANEIRRRLAQYNGTAGPGQRVRIELPPGSYVPQFHWLEGAETNRTGRFPKIPRKAFVAGLCALMLLLSAAVWVRKTSAGPVEAFWRPVLDSANPALICLGHPVVYLLSQAVHQRYRARSGKTLDQGPYELKFEPGEVLGADIIPVPDQYVGVGDAQAGFRIGTKLELMGKKSQFRTGYDVAFADLKSSPIVLVGAYSNRWTKQVTRPALRLRANRRRPESSRGPQVGQVFWRALHASRWQSGRRLRARLAHLPFRIGRSVDSRRGPHAVRQPGSRRVPDPTRACSRKPCAAPRRTGNA